MNAQQARKLAYEANTNESESQYAKIMESIKQAVKNGEYHTFVYENINQDVRNKLELNDFKVSDNQGRYNEILYKIVW